MSMHDVSRREFCQAITTGAAVTALAPQALIAAEDAMLMRKIPMRRIDVRPSRRADREGLYKKTLEKASSRE